MTHAHILYFLIFSKWRKFLLPSSSQQTVLAHINSTRGRGGTDSHCFNIRWFIRGIFAVKWLHSSRSTDIPVCKDSMSCITWTSTHPFGCFSLSQMNLIRSSVPVPEKAGSSLWRYRNQEILWVVVRRTGTGLWNCSYSLSSSCIHQLFPRVAWDTRVSNFGVFGWLVSFAWGFFCLFVFSNINLACFRRFKKYILKWSVSETYYYEFIQVKEKQNKRTPTKQNPPQLKRTCGLSKYRY